MTRASDAESVLSPAEHVSLCEALDRVLNKGAVVSGDVVISVADIDLIYLGLRLVLTSVESARNLGLTHVPTGVPVNRADIETGDGALERAASRIRSDA